MRTALVVLLFSLGLTSCGVPGACTLIGCNNTVAFKLTNAALQQFVPGEAVSVKACLGTVCQTGTVTNENNGSSSSTNPALLFDATTSLLSMSFTNTVTGAQDVSLELSKGGSIFLSDQRSGVTLTENRPNGPLCAPVCQGVTITL